MQHKEPGLRTILLLVTANVFLTFAWYGHLKHTGKPLPTVIVGSWPIALVEYCFQVPANRLGHGQFSAAQLKVTQEVITPAVFAVFSIKYLGEAIQPNHRVAFGLVVAAVGVVFRG